MNFKSVGLCCVGGIVAFVGVLHAFWLLSDKAVTGTDYVWLNAAYLITGLLIPILPKVTELTFSNLSLKIAAANQAAAVTLEQLNQALEHSFAPALVTVTDFPGSFPNLGPRDDRLAKFFALAEAIEKAGLRARFAGELADAARKIAVGQLEAVARFNCHYQPTHADFYALPTPETVKVEACSPEGILQTAELHGLSPQETVKNAMKAAEAYREIYKYTL
ncbi:hypothetical protein [Pseudomonas sp.]|uniref:hypothetical protein n=1 Tax=Pseudomonas sp. TaxID=306 RepID=UPI00289D782E|nr:hypothetical protein [Pseudomonas sp.]